MPARGGPLPAPEPCAPPGRTTTDSRRAVGTRLLAVVCPGEARDFDIGSAARAAQVSVGGLAVAASK